MIRVAILILVLVQMFVAELMPATPNPPQRDSVDNPQVNLNDTAVKTFLDKIEIYGRIAKPQTVFIIPGADPRVDGIRIERRFFSDIFREVEKSTLRKEMIQDQQSKDHILW